MIAIHSKFESEFQVRPDDIDMNQHVHNSRYFDYVLAARYDQLERCYKMPMEEFLQKGFGWVVRTARIEFKRPLGLGDWFTVRTWIEEVLKDGVRVQFEIIRKSDGKMSCLGEFDYAIIDLKTGRSTKVPEWMKERYTI